MRKWYRWFAWYPVRIDGRMVWLRWLERRDAYYSHEDDIRLPLRQVEIEAQRLANAGMGPANRNA